MAANLRRGVSLLDADAAVVGAIRRAPPHYAGYIADDLWALWALLQRSGDCTEYAYLAVALARANGIPARMVGGYVTDRNIAPRAEEYHNWAELYVDGAWRLLDAQKENWLAPVQQYIAFRFYRDSVINPVGLAHRFNVSGEMQVRL
ncbi:transglutaminase-like domain-containing protein [Paraherbaspirillum soli]|uniref:Transglutaminase family protein n=1 Tax=Paraherbaspirillum soli TaxID=631222 RepID=A0ABW0MA15_9BURK